MVKWIFPCALISPILAVGVGPSESSVLNCPTSNCWCRDTFVERDIRLNSNVYYRTAFNKVLKENQTLFLDEYFASSKTDRPGALIIHGGGFSSGPYNGCSHAKNMTSFAEVAMALARRGFVAVSIDYRCEGKLRADQDYFHPWYDAVEDARAAVRYMVANAARLNLDTSRIMAFGGSAGAVTVAQLLHALPDGTPMPPPAPSPPPPPSHCETILKELCPLPFPGGYEDCLKCSREHAPHPICKPSQRVAYCNGTMQSTKVTGGNVTCGIALSGAIPPESINAGQVVASEHSPPYLDFHGTKDTTVPYSNTSVPPAKLVVWGDAVDTKQWLDSHSAPNYLVPIPGAGHVPFGTIPPCDPKEKDASIGCWNTTFFGFLLRAMHLDAVPCPQ